MANYRVMPASTEAKLDVLFAALSDPSRRAILRRLADGEATVGEVAAPLRMAAPSVSKHLKVLESAGLIQRRVEGRTHHLSLRPEPLHTAAEWLAFYRGFWEGGVDRLAELAADLESERPRSRKRT
jgi:DNA-binding transcriptional ArsR family regulator